MRHGQLVEPNEENLEAPVGSNLKASNPSSSSIATFPDTDDSDLEVVQEMNDKQEKGDGDNNEDNQDPAVGRRSYLILRELILLRRMMWGFDRFENHLINIM